MKSVCSRPIKPRMANTSDIGDRSRRRSGGAMAVHHGDDNARGQFAALPPVCTTGNDASDNHIGVEFERSCNIFVGLLVAVLSISESIRSQGVSGPRKMHGGCASVHDRFDEGLAECHGSILMVPADRRRVPVGPAEFALKGGK